MRFHKSRTDKVVFGVCGGIGETMGINPLIIRVILVVLAMSTWSLFFWLYIILGIFLPYGDEIGGQGQRPGSQERPPFHKNTSNNRPPFDISNAKDVDIEKRYEKQQYNEEEFYKKSQDEKDDDFGKN